MIMDQVIFREYDIRGVYYEQFDLDFAYQLGKSFASYVFKKTGHLKIKILKKFQFYLIHLINTNTTH